MSEDNSEGYEVVVCDTRTAHRPHTWYHHSVEGPLHCGGKREKVNIQVVNNRMLGKSTGPEWEAHTTVDILNSARGYGNSRQEAIDMCVDSFKQMKELAERRAAARETVDVEIAW